MREVVIVGAGIVGTALARELAAKDDVRVTVLDQADGAPLGSTAFAPGFVGLYNDAPILVELARSSANVYESVGSAFARTGGLELATTPTGLAEAERRVAAASRTGLDSQMLAPDELPASVTAFADTDRVLGGGWFPDDGVADPVPLTAELRRQAEERGARLLGGQRVVDIDVQDDLVVSTATGERFVANDVVLAGGVWGPTLTSLVDIELPLFPVAHPYVYSADGNRFPGPFVRWPEHHVYARVHGHRLGIGSYDHAPVPIDQPGLDGGAGLMWTEDFDPVIEKAQQLLRAPARFEPDRRINGVFAMTPDNLPFLGPHPTLPGIWVAQAIWVTHAAGAAGLLAAAMTDGPHLPEPLAVDRFAGRDIDELSVAAYRLYRDIYANDAV